MHTYIHTHTYIYTHTYVSNAQIFEQKLSTAWLLVQNNKSEILHNTINGQKRLVLEKHVTVKWCKTSMTDLHAPRSGTCKTAIRSSRTRRAFRDYHSSGTTSLRQSQLRSQSRELPHASRSTAAIVASSASGVPGLCGLPEFITQRLMETPSHGDAAAVD